MKYLIFAVIAIVLAIGCFIIYRIFASKAEAKRFAEFQNSVFEPIIKKLDNNEDLTSQEVDELAANPSTRQNFYYLLNDYGKQSLFPKQYFTLEKAAESNMVNWLEYPTELDGTPNEIELLQTVSVLAEGDELRYFVFKFRTFEPHWAAKDGWMIGVAGPTLADSQPYDHLPSTFSRLSKLDSISAKDEVEWVHQNITSRN